MLRKAREIQGYKLQATDGKIGKVKEFYFDDISWTIRYLVADTGSWLPKRKVLISPYALGQIREIVHTYTPEALGPIERKEGLLEINLTKEQIEKSPSIDANKPVSIQHEMEYFKYFGWPWYGADIGLGHLGPIVPPPAIAPVSKVERGDPHLRSTQEVTGYHIQALDTEVGHVDDFYLEDRSWIIRYLLIDTKNWLPGRSVLVSPRWIEKVSWEESKVFVSLSAEAIKKAPSFDPSAPVTREYEEQLHRAYAQTFYWT